MVATVQPKVEQPTVVVATLGFSHSICDNSLFTYHNGNDTAYILLYVDDIILTASSDTLRQSIMSKLSSEFAMKDLGPLKNIIDKEYFIF